MSDEDFNQVLSNVKNMAASPPNPPPMPASAPESTSDNPEFTDLIKNLHNGTQDFIDTHNESLTNKIVNGINQPDDISEDKLLADWQKRTNEATLKDSFQASDFIDIGKTIAATATKEINYLAASGHPLLYGAGQFARMIGNFPTTLETQAGKYIGEHFMGLKDDDTLEHEQVLTNPVGELGKSLGIASLSGELTPEQQKNEKIFSEVEKILSGGAINPEYEPKTEGGSIAQIATTFIPMLAGGEGSILAKSIALAGVSATPVELARIVKENGGSKNTQNLVSGLGMIVGGVAGHYSGAAITEAMSNPPLPIEIAKGIDNGIFPDAPPEAKAEAAQIVKSITPQEVAAKYSAADELAKPTLAGAMAKINPQTHAEYTALKDRYSLVGEGIKNLKEEQLADIEASAPHAEEIADLQKKLETANPRKTKIYQDKLDELTSQRENYIKENSSKDTPEIADLRSKQQELDFRMRDLAPTISEMRRKAIEDNPHLEVYTPKTTAIEEPAPIVEEAIKPETPSPEPAPVEPVKVNIAADIEKKAIAAGYGAEEAKASAKILAKQYDYLASVYGGKAEDFYSRFGAKIKAGKSTKVSGSYRPSEKLIKLMKSANPSTLIHEGAHHFLDMMKDFSSEKFAPEKIKSDMQIIKDWLKVGEDGQFTRAMEEKFARGFEQYMRDGIAPTRELADTFAKFAKWLREIYNTTKQIAKLGKKIPPEIRDFFDRTLEPNTALHEKEGVIIEPEEIAPAPTTKNVAAKEPESAKPSSEPASAPANIPEIPTGGKPEKSKPVDKLFDKAGNIRLENLTNAEEARAALRELAKKQPDLLNHDTISDKEIKELADSLGVKAKDINIEKLRQLAIEDDVPLAARIRSSREMLLEAEKDVRSLAEKVDGGTEADLRNFLEAKARFGTVAETVSAVTNQMGRAFRAFQDITSEELKSSASLSELFQQETGATIEDVRKLAKLISERTNTGASAKILQDMDKPNAWRTFAAYRRCSILSGYITHAAWLAGTTFNLAYKAVVLDTMQGLHNEIGMRVFGRKDTGSTIGGGIEGLANALTKALPNILSATGTALRTGKTVLRPFEKEYDTYLASGNIRKTLNVNMEELRKVVDSQFKNATEEQKKEATRIIAAKMQSRLKTWSDLATEINDFGTSALSGITSTVKKLASTEFYENNPLYEKKYVNEVPNYYVKGLPVLPVGSVLGGMSNRIYSTMHTFSRELAANIETLQEARRIATEEGLGGEARERRIQDLVENPTEDFMNRVNHIANKQTLMSNESEFAKSVTRFRNALDKVGDKQIGSILMPVVTVPAEAVHQTVVESLPVGLLFKAEREALSGKKGALEQERAQVKMIAGTSLLGLGFYLAYKQLATPSASVIYTHEQQRTDSGNPSNSLRVGDWMVNLQHTPVTGTIITTGADLFHILNNQEAFGEDSSDKLKPAIYSAVNNLFLHENALVGLSDAIDMARGKTDMGTWLKNQTVSTVVPQFVKQTSDLTDPYARESKSFMSALISKIPIQSETIAPKIDSLTGEPIERHPSHIIPAHKDAIANELSNLYIYPANPKPMINGVALTAKQGAEYSAIKGHVLHDGLKMLMLEEGRDDYQSATKEQKVKMVRRVAAFAAKTAKNAMLFRHDDILRKANQKVEDVDDVDFSPIVKSQQAILNQEE